MSDLILNNLTDDSKIKEYITTELMPKVFHDIPLNVLNTGLETDEFFEVQEMDFDGLLNKIEKYYDIHIENDESDSWITIMDIVNTIIKSI